MNEMRKLMEAVEQLDETTLFRNPDEMVKYMMRELKKIEAYMEEAHEDRIGLQYGPTGSDVKEEYDNVWNMVADLLKRMENSFPAYTE